MKEFGENFAEFSEAGTSCVRCVRTSKRPPVDFTRLPTDMRALPSTEREWEDALHILAKPKSGSACGPGAIPSELSAAGGQGYRRGLGGFCVVSRERAPIAVEGERHGGRSWATHTEQYERSAVFQLPKKDVCQRATSSGRAVAPNVSWYVANGRQFAPEERNSRS